jgi:hypothetical protein
MRLDRAMIVKYRWMWLTLVVVGSLARGWGAFGEDAAAIEARLRATAAYLADDAREGRGVGTQGLEQAAEYLAEQFRAAGLKTDLIDGTPFQRLEVTLAAERGRDEDNRLVLVGPPDAQGKSQQIPLALDQDFTPLAAGGSGTFDAPLVFAGYGITALSLKRGDEAITYDDYAGVDVRGKVVILLRKEPQQNDPASPFDGTQTTPYSLFVRKLTNAREHGAAAVILVNDGPELVSRRQEQLAAVRQAIAALDPLKERLSAAQPQQDDLTELGRTLAQKAQELAQQAQQLAQSADGLLPFSGAGANVSHAGMPVLFCRRAVIDRLLAAALGKDLVALEREIDSDLVPRSQELAGWRARGQTAVIEKKTQIRNVLGVLEGRGPLADQTIVVGAHYDHLGYGGEGSLAPWTREIHNGADDNASGTAALVEIARRLADSDPSPRRRILFIAFTGEERGLLGSSYYVQHPLFPLASTVAMVNLDMVGRLTDDKLAVYGTGTATEFDALIERLAGERGFALSKHPGGYGPSDHSSFYAKRIPVLHFFTGTHRDYHRPSDDVEKLNLAGMRRVVELVATLVQTLATQPEPPTYVEIRRIEQIGDPAAAGDRPSFGSMPAYPNPAKDGVLLEAVLEGSPADKAGIRGGDVLLEFGGERITVLEEFEAALRRHRPGDRVKVKVRRGEEVLEAEVTLARRRPAP